jgi:hypothetical protein
MIQLNQEDAAALYGIYQRALDVLTEAEAVLWSLPKQPERDEFVHAHADVIVSILSKLRAPLVLQYPDLDTDVPEGPADTLLDDEEQKAVAGFTEDQVQLIDEMLLAECAPSWRKVARIVGTVSTRGPAEFADIPIGFYALRVRALVVAGKLESQGNLDYMRFSEVRLPG